MVDLMVDLMVDSPRFNRPLADSIDVPGGIAHVLLTHRGDVADADRWAERYDLQEAPERR